MQTSETVVPLYRGLLACQTLVFLPLCALQPWRLLLQSSNASPPYSCSRHAMLALSLLPSGSCQRRLP